MTCDQCIAARNAGPCPHDATRLVERYGREQYERGLRVGFERLLHMAVVIDGHQEKGKRRRPMPLGIVKSAARGGAGAILSALEKVNHDLAEQWKVEAREAFDGEKT